LVFLEKQPVNEKKEKKEKKTTEKKIDTKIISFNLFKKGKKLSEIALERNLSASTIEGHLIHFIGLGAIDINEIIPAAKQDLIRNAVKIHGSLSHKTLNENLPSNISYGEIRMVLAAEKTI
jgi:ATP-dependent DNA helicase RecQ